MSSKISIAITILLRPKGRNLILSRWQQILEIELKSFYFLYLIQNPVTTVFYWKERNSAANIFPVKRYIWNRSTCAPNASQGLAAGVKCKKQMYVESFSLLQLSSMLPRCFLSWILNHSENLVFSLKFYAEDEHTILQIICSSVLVSKV